MRSSGEASNTCSESHLPRPSNPSRHTFRIDSEMASKLASVGRGNRSACERFRRAAKCACFRLACSRRANASKTSAEDFMQIGDDQTDLQEVAKASGPQHLGSGVFAVPNPESSDYMAYSKVIVPNITYP